MKLPEGITVDPEIMMGKPCVKGTRIPVYVLLQKMAAGETEAELLKAYPQLSKADLRAAWEYEGRVARTGGLRELFDAEPSFLRLSHSRKRPHRRSMVHPRRVLSSLMSHSLPKHPERALIRRMLMALRPSWNVTKTELPSKEPPCTR
jgi:uncharacterized protein (DUF433 family)